MGKDERALPLRHVAIVRHQRNLEDRGFTKVTEVDYDDGVYDIEVHLAGGTEKHFKFDAVSGREAQ